MRQPAATTLCPTLPFLLLWVALALWLLASGRHPGPVQAQAEATVRYPAGWNLVAAPTGTDLSKAAGSAFAFGPGATAYDPLGPGELVGGRAAWVFFPQDTTITLGKSAAEYSRILLPAGAFVLAGNPSSSEAVAISGADAAYTYDPAQGLYQQVSELQPGQGAFLVSRAGGVISFGKAPAGAMSDDLTRLQQAVTAQPSDRGTIDQLSAVTAALVRQRQYAQVQTVLDDLRAADDDGFRLAGAELAGPLDKVQLDSEVALRENVARAKAAVASNDLAAADAAMEAAQRAAQAAVDDAVAAAQTRGTSALTYAQATPGGLGAARALFRAGLPFAGTGQLLSETFFVVATAQLSTTPVPPATPPTTQPSTPPAPCLLTPCTFSGEGTVTLRYTEGAVPDVCSYTVAMTITFTLTVNAGQVVGQGQGTGTTSGTGRGCRDVSFAGSFTVSGTQAGATLHLRFVAPIADCQSLFCQNDDGSDAYSPLDIPAWDGATGMTSVSPQTVRSDQQMGVVDLSGTLAVTLHATPL